MVNDRWGILFYFYHGQLIFVQIEIIGDGTSCSHGGFFNCYDGYNPDKLQEHKWENAMILDKHSWGYRRDARLEVYLTTHELLTNLAQTVRYCYH